MPIFFLFLVCNFLLFFSFIFLCNSNFVFCWELKQINKWILPTIVIFGLISKSNYYKQFFIIIEVMQIKLDDNYYLLQYEIICS